MSRNKANKNRKNAGGVATYSGINYQNRVAAWFCVRILAEQDASPLWHLPETTIFERLYCEIDQPVDDLLIRTSESGRVFIQVKHNITLEVSDSSALASTIDQFVRQFILNRQSTNVKESLKGPFDQERDRLVLVTSSRSSSAIREHLPAILARIRRQAADQTLDEAATNVEQRKVLRVIRSHLGRSWREVTGAAPSNKDIKEILRLVWVQTLDVDEEGIAEQAAKDSICTSIVEDTSQADTVWNHLIQACANYAASQTSADRAGLQQELLSVGIRLRGSRSFHGDIEQLRLHSASTLRALIDFSRVLISNKEVKITRPSTLALRSAAEEESLIVVGEPGAGKSGTLYNVVNILNNEGRDFVFFAVDRLEARGLGALRDELRLTHELVDVLENWIGAHPAFLVIDAFDAARSNASARTIYDLVADVQKRAPRWHVIVSIRKFDLRYNEKLRRLFNGEPPTEFSDKEFWNVRHLNVPRLSQDEWLQIPLQSLELAILYARASANLRELLHNPFNLRLAGELLGEGVSVESLSPIETQIGLLDHYWKHRVIRDDHKGDAREVVLRRATEAMVSSRSLRVNRAEVASDIAVSETLHDVLSSHVLSEWHEPSRDTVEHSVLTFAHHMLFDYSVARLMLRGMPQTLISQLERESDLVMAIRPSVVMHFQHERMRSDEAFWDVIFRVIRSPQIPEIGKLIGPSVAVEMSSGVENFAPLIRGLSSDDHNLSEVAEKALRHLAGALLVNTAFSGDTIVGNAAAPWAELFDHLSDPLRLTTAYAIRPVLLAMCEHPDSMTHEQQHFAGRIARRLLEFALAQKETRDPWLVISGLQAVCHTFESDPSGSAYLLRRLLEPSHVAAYGHEELFRLGNELDRLISLDPELVEEMYKTTFTYRDYSNERTIMVGSRIVPLTSTRRQDYDMARFAFAGKFKEFMDKAPLQATRSLIAAMKAYDEERHASSLRWTRNEESKETFEFNGHTVTIKTDYSDVWDNSGPSRNDKQMQMLDVFQKHLEGISSDAKKIAEREQLINLIVEENGTSVFWRRLLVCGAAAPQTLGYELRSLGWMIPILLGFDTKQPAGEFLSKVFGLLSSEERERVERTVLSIPDEVDVNRREYAIYSRNQLLGCLSFEHLVTREAKTIIEELQAEGSVPSNDPRPPVQAMTLPYTDRDFLAGQGVPVDEEQNQRIQNLSAPIRDFASRYLNGTPKHEEVKEVLPTLRALWQALVTAEADGVHESQRDLAWGYLADAASAMSLCEEVSCEMGDGIFLKSVLLEASEYPQPVHYPENDESFDSHPSWGSPAARIDAAEGVVRLARHLACVDESLCKAIRRLSNDSVLAVRYMVAGNLLNLYNTAPELMWELIEHFSQEETSQGVLQGLIGTPLNRLAGHHTDRAVSLVRHIFGRTREGAGATEVKKLCASIFNGLYIWQDNAASGETLNEIVVNLPEHADAVHQILFDLRSVLNIGPVNPPDPEKDMVRQRAFGLILKVVRHARDMIRALEEKNKDLTFTSWAKDEQELGSSLANIAESVSMEIYFASGAYRDNADDVVIPRSARARLRFLHEAKDVLDILCDFGYASLTHHLMQTLEYLVSFDPENVFLLAARVVRAGKKDFYQHESLAVDLIVRMTERFIAEFRYVLQDNEECRRALIEILDTFVDAGWPSARRLAYRLEEVYR